MTIPDCSNNQVTTYLGTYCILNRIGDHYMSLTVAFGCLLLIGILYKIFLRSKRIVKKTLTPSKYLTYDETYCSISLLTLKITQAYILVIGFELLFNSIIFSISFVNYAPSENCLFHNSRFTPVQIMFELMNTVKLRTRKVVQNL